tara:strand:- start:23594 stop:24376 length:783 start_codon:yes stop_codon:yes gene_type:complete
MNLGMLVVLATIIVVVIIAILLIVSRTKFQRDSKVPRIIHQMWYDKVVYDNDYAPSSYTSYRGYTDSWTRLNSTYRYKFWNKGMINELWKHEDLICYADFFYALDKHIEKCDFARYALLYLEGGIYVDLDFICEKSIDPLLRKTREIALAREPTTHLTDKYKYITNGFMISSPKSKFWLSCMNYVMANYDGSKNPVDNTGPGMLDKFTEQNSHHNIFFIPAHLIIPVDKYGNLHASIKNKLVYPYCKTIWEEGTDWHDDL